MNESVKKTIRSYCPNIKPLRKWMTNQKLSEYKSYYMNSDMVCDGEKSDEGKRNAIIQYTNIKSKHAHKIKDSLKIYTERINDPIKKEQMKLLEDDVLFCCYAYGFSPDEYFVYELENKSIDERKSYISDLERYLMVYQMNDIIDMDLYLDKYRTYKLFHQYYKRDAVLVGRNGNKKEFLDFVQKHPIFVEKNVAYSRGESVTLKDIHSIDMSPSTYYDVLSNKGDYILEEKVEQSEVMNSLNQTSVNTVRCIVFQTKSGVRIGPCFLKVGQGGSFIDNGGTGGILVGIDNETGELLTNGYDEFLKEYKKHPDTGTEFIGYQLPEWDQMINLVKEMSQKTPSIHYIGWDMAHTNDGWVVIEGNCCGQMIGPQIVFKRGFKQDVIALTGKEL